MSDLRITKRDEKEQSSDWMTLVHEEDNQVLIDVLSIASPRLHMQASIWIAKRLKRWPTGLTIFFTQLEKMELQR